MATITRGSHDPIVDKVKTVLEEYEHAHPGSEASLYRQDPLSIRIRIVSDQFTGWSRGKRHDYAWDFISSRLTDKEIEDISILLLFTPKELSKSSINSEFDDPIPSPLQT
ncbi:MAG TPA: hypothetical protein VN541_24300 [Tepidisphaeraceae bacterium]|nr:hypothetical protein [Tepidisphaeraceae bacterium]